MYPFYSIPAETTDLGMPEYRFAYDLNHMPNGYILPQADRWGYWNGQTHKLADSNLEAPTSVNATKSETLVEVIYPTGGRTVLEYEGHDYSRLENDGHVLMDKYGVSGGLRVRRITKLSREDSIVSTKVFHYREGISTSARSSGVAKAPDPVAVTYNAGNNYVWTGQHPQFKKSPRFLKKGLQLKRGCAIILTFLERNVRTTKYGGIAQLGARLKR